MNARQRGGVAVVARNAGLMLGLTLGLALGGAPLAAQTLSDPTRPPAAFTTPAPADGAAAGVPGAPKLQSVLLSRNPGGRAVAVISGQTVRLGGKVGDAVLYRISQNEVVLKRGRALETLRLYPNSSAGKVNDGASPAKP